MAPHRADDAAQPPVHSAVAADEGDDGDDAGGRVDRPAWVRLAWFVGLWAAGVAVVATVGYALRWVLL
ncbi:hypothetical protein EV659_11528 [Rhodothalassium salexigens DSM 2132]|uniref:DUF2474 family protein n=1 Tax=Rhodothalassium salexigens DSM 2132 TaxID=1188247 RepID=A0A4R2P5T8_RHOSA|nr:hypothetical protein [Rhodothalassium salexigens]MBB4212724.1 hypothetical protein [Rhodothalassium salexigens DSM 2132]MBK1639227.1 hypothetical protein [Rhodothalassium salexigens DSM 2132]TCP30173.1 hypothetical protein EV659_11528 [Rhodothalassium salexigens DSM 2132]